ncbi:MAG: hypothetical protein AB2556_23725 [Candidatus Thiodiazotropha sp.]
MSLLSLRTDWVKFVFDDPFTFLLLADKLDLQEKVAVRESSEYFGRPLVCHAGVQGQPSGSFIDAISDLGIAYSACSFHPPCGEDRRGAIDFKLILGVNKGLDPRAGWWRPHRRRDLVVRVDKWLGLTFVLDYFQS